MNRASSRIRLYVSAELSEGASFALDEKQAHYITQVMRLKLSDTVSVFNGKDGEWLTEITEVKKRAVLSTCVEQLKPQKAPPDIWLVFAPIKLGRIDYLVEKATELGAAELLPVRTERTIVSRINDERLGAHMIEAAEQTERLDVPMLHPLRPLGAVLAEWPKDRTLFFCDETGGGTPLKAIQSAQKKVGILIGPEGGFTPTEGDSIRSLPFTMPVCLGPRILRADTAAIAALTGIQMMLGDWA